MKRLFFLLILMYAHVIFSEDIAGENPGTIILNINLSNVDNSRMVNDARFDAQQNMNQFAKNGKGASLPIQDMKSFIMDNFKAYKWHIATAIAVSSYGLLCYFMIKGNDYLKRSDLWSSYRKELSFDEILAIPQKQFAQDLLREIQRRYNTNFATSVMLFIKAIDQEESNIRWYRSFYAWISFLHIQKLVPIDTAMYTNIERRLNIIAYFKNCYSAIESQLSL